MLFFFFCTALDNQSESVVQEYLDSTQRERITITIAHRLSTIKNATRIFVMDHGEIIEQVRCVCLVSLVFVPFFARSFPLHSWVLCACQLPAHKEIYTFHSQKKQKTRAHNKSWLRSKASSGRCFRHRPLRPTTKPSTNRPKKPSNRARTRRKRRRRRRTLKLPRSQRGCLGGSWQSGRGRRASPTCCTSSCRSSVRACWPSSGRCRLSSWPRP